MIERLYNKLCVALRLQDEIVAAGLPVDPSQGARFYGVFANTDETNPYTKVFLYNDITQQETDIVDTVVANHIPIPMPPLPDQPVDDEGKPYVRAESRPVECTTVFTSMGDSANNIGDGKMLHWDFSNNDDIITAPTGYKRKRLEFQFLDTVYLKEGSLFFDSLLKGSYFDCYIVCPTGYYYYSNSGEIRIAAQDTPVAHYVIRQPIRGSTSSGLQLATETCSSAIPSYYKFWTEISVPEADTSSFGCLRIMLYRERTVILP